MEKGLEEWMGTKDSVLVLIIYDIVDNKRRQSLAKFLQGYGFRVQKSAFEAVLSKKNYMKLIHEIQAYVKEEDSIRIYKIVGYSQVTVFESAPNTNFEEVIIV